MANYKPDLSCQNKFIPINFAEQILPGTFEVTIHGDHALAEENQNKLNELSEITKDISLKLREQMRCDLKAI